MAGTIINPVRSDMYLEDVSQGRALSEALLQKMASGINFINQKQVMRLNFGAIGSYYSGSPQSVGLPEIIEFDSEVVNCWVSNGTPGSSGITEVDLKVQSLAGGAWNSMFSTTAKFATNSLNGSKLDSSGKVVTLPLGTTRPVFSNTLLNAGDSIRFDLLQAMVGGADVYINLHIRPR